MEDHKQFFRSSLAVFVEKINIAALKSLLDHLLSEEVLSTEEKNMILCKVMTTDKNREFMYIIIEKPAKQLQIVFDYLKENQEHEFSAMVKADNEKKKKMEKKILKHMGNQSDLEQYVDEHESELIQQLKEEVGEKEVDRIEREVKHYRLKKKWSFTPSEVHKIYTNKKVGVFLKISPSGRVGVTVPLSKATDCLFSKMGKEDKEEEEEEEEEEEDHEDTGASDDTKPAIDTSQVASPLKRNARLESGTASTLAPGTRHCAGSVISGHTAQEGGTCKLRPPVAGRHMDTTVAQGSPKDLPVQYIFTAPTHHATLQTKSAAFNDDSSKPVSQEAPNSRETGLLGASIPSQSWHADLCTGHSEESGEEGSGASLDSRALMSKSNHQKSVDSFQKHKTLDDEDKIGSSTKHGNPSLNTTPFTAPPESISSVTASTLASEPVRQRPPYQPGSIDSGNSSLSQNIGFDNSNFEEKVTDAPSSDETSSQTVQGTLETRAEEQVTAYRKRSGLRTTSVHKKQKLDDAPQTCSKPNMTGDSTPMEWVAEESVSRPTDTPVGSVGTGSAALNSESNENATANDSIAYNGEETSNTTCAELPASPVDKPIISSTTTVTSKNRLKEETTLKPKKTGVGSKTNRGRRAIKKVDEIQQINMHLGKFNIKDLSTLSYINYREHKEYGLLYVTKCLVYNDTARKERVLLRIETPHEEDETTAQNNKTKNNLFPKILKPCEQLAEDFEFSLQYHMGVLGNMRRADVLFVGNKKPLHKLSYRETYFLDVQDIFSCFVAEILAPVLAVYKKAQRAQMLENSN